MIRRSPDFDWDRVVILKDRSQIAMKFSADLLVQKRVAIFCAKDQMDDDRSKGLPHDSSRFQL